MSPVRVDLRWTKTSVGSGRDTCFPFDSVVVEFCRAGKGTRFHDEDWPDVRWALNAPTASFSAFDHDSRKLVVNALALCLNAPT